MAEWKRLARALPHFRKLRQIFDPGFYVAKYPDIAAALVDPFRHYVEHGAFEARKPRALFDPDYYSLLCPGAAESGEPVIMHFLAQTGERCQNPHPLFDCASYVAAHPEVESRKMNPLLHYLSSIEPNGIERNGIESVAAPRNCETARFDFMDVELLIGFVRSEEEATLHEGIVCVWEDAAGRMRFTAPEQQRPFFEVMKCDQLRAQAVIRS